MTNENLSAEMALRAVRARLDQAWKEIENKSSSDLAGILSAWGTAFDGIEDIVTAAGFPSEWEDGPQ